MRSRSNSGVRLDYYHRIVYKIILSRQNPVTGLFPASLANEHAWIRDNVYCVLSVWGLSMAYKKIADQDEDRAKTYELEQSCVKLMRGLLMAMMRQKDKVERFKQTQHPLDSLHAKYSSSTGAPVVGDKEWGHLQIDAVSLYLLVLAQMTASGLQVVQSLDEVALVQNLVFYIESAYCIPDYGIWERGDKTNHGLPELNASSIGMAKAALEAINELDLFGARGGPYSIIHVLADEAQKCQAVLQSMLPRESNSKEIDSGLLSVISFPAFAIEDPDLIQHTRNSIIDKLQGKYGLKRFLRDGYKTAKEDPSRLYYEPWELRMFENIECEWPLFFCYLIIDYCFQKNSSAVAEYAAKLEEIMIKNEEGIKFVPELYSVPSDHVVGEYEFPGSQKRVPLGHLPFLWAQSLYIVGKLLQENFLAPGELDPLNRRLCSEKKPDVVVQVVILAEDDYVKGRLAEHDIIVQSVADVAPIEVQPARVLSFLYTYLGRNKKLGLTGRKSRDVGILSTSKLYSLGDRIFAFTPQNFDMEQYYTSHNAALLLDKIVTHLAFLTINWRMLGRPTLSLIATHSLLEDGKLPHAMITTIKKLKSGYINGTRVTLGNLCDFLNTSCITNLNFLGSHEEGLPDKLNPEVQKYLEEYSVKSLSTKPSLLASTGTLRNRNRKRKMSVKGAVKKTRSINVDAETLGMEGLASIERRGSVYMPSMRHDTVDGPAIDQTGPQSPEQPALFQETRQSSGTHRRRNSSISKNSKGSSEQQYADTEVEELFAMLRETESLDEQGDILQYLADTQGLDLSTDMIDGGQVITVRHLLKGLYEKACQGKRWGLVRHTAGMLGKRVEDLAKAVTDLLVRQKQVTVGMPPDAEHAIVAPLPEGDLRQLIREAHGGDDSTAMLTQELLVYLAMFIRTEPHLFQEMLRLRVGLIIQVMASELARTLQCVGDEASEHLLNLSPYEMKNLLYHIISGNEFNISNVGRGNYSIISNKSGRISRKSHISIPAEEPQHIEEPNRQGQWLRRRCLDGALNRVPKEFYPKVWAVLERCHGLDMGGKVLPRSLTQEMTSGELKFALAVEAVLNTIPQPEYRQLLVEALMVLTLVPEHDLMPSMGGIISIDRLVHRANELFLKDQEECNGDATLCCAHTRDPREVPGVREPACEGAASLCLHFYDSAPSGRYGTMTYMMKAAAETLECLPQHGNLDCTIS